MEDDGKFIKPVVPSHIVLLHTIEHKYNVFFFCCLNYPDILQPLFVLSSLFMATYMSSVWSTRDATQVTTFHILSLVLIGVCVCHAK